MDFELTERERHFRDRVRDFMTVEVRPRACDVEAEIASGDRWAPLQVIEELKGKAKAAGLWNLFLPPTGEHGEADDGFVFTGERLTNLEYALYAEEMGRLQFTMPVDAFG